MHGEHNQSMSEGLTFGGKEEALEICKAIKKKNQKSKIKNQNQNQNQNVRKNSFWWYAMK